MLQSIQVENFAIVEQLKLNLNNGLIIISGETGSGKSILIDALSLVLGERADSSVVRPGSETARVSAIFTISTATKNWLQQQDLQNTDNEDECFIRRVIKNNGRSRGYINDLPVSLQTLKQLGEFLVDIHGQHAHQSLLRSDSQRQLLDDVLEDKTALMTLQYAYQQWHDLHTELDKLASGVQDRDANLTLLRYQVEELEEFELTEESVISLNEEHRRLANANELLEKNQQALNLLGADHANSALSCLNQAHSYLSSVEKYDPQLSNIISLIEAADIQTQEAVNELRHYVEHLHMDPERLNWIDERIGALQNLARKHKVGFIELPQYFQRLTMQLQELEAYKERARDLEIQVTETLINYRIAAKALHEQRLKQAKPLADEITTNMQQLGLPGGYLTIEVHANQSTTPTSVGTDKVEFLVNTNPGQLPKPLQKIVSGGELSRISLAIQVITAKTTGVPTLIFDEVDVGIGGGVAEIVGQLLRQLGEQRQVICITHLPQVACHGHHHLQVTKKADTNSTHATIKILTKKQRLEEIARMLGGIKITPQTLAHAKEMLQRCAGL